MVARLTAGPKYL